MEPTWKVKYVAGGGVLLQIPLSDGQIAFKQGLVYTVKTYEDFLRLTRNGDFVEFKQDQIAAKPVVAPVVKDEPSKSDASGENK